MEYEIGWRLFSLGMWAAFMWAISRPRFVVKNDKPSTLEDITKDLLRKTGNG